MDMGIEGRSVAAHGNGRHGLAFSGRRAVSENDAPTSHVRLRASDREVSPEFTREARKHERILLRAHDSTV
jgi:hypothetical protein